MQIPDIRHLELIAQFPPRNGNPDTTNRPKIRPAPRITATDRPQAAIPARYPNGNRCLAFHPLGINKHKTGMDAGRPHAIV